MLHALYMCMLYVNEIGATFVELRERIINTARETSLDWNIERRFELYPKLIVIIPRNGYNVATLSAYDPKVQPLLSKSQTTVDGFGAPIKARYTRDMVGHPNRDYSTPLFKTSHNGKVWSFECIILHRYMMYTVPLLNNHKNT